MKAKYKCAKCIGHPKASKEGWLREHILIAEKALGKYLPKGSVVHHVDCNSLNNSNTNLVICQDKIYHSMLHRRIEAKRATGNANSVKCKYCKGWG